MPTQGADVLDGEVYARIIRLRDYGAKPQLDWLRERAYAYLKPKRIPMLPAASRRRQN